jgi:prepilin peptidase CpaA
MLFSPIVANTILIITSIALFWAAMTDLREFKISNGLIIVLAVLFFVHAVVSGRWTSLHWNLVLAFSLFCIMLYFYSHNWMGGGDVKMLAVAFLWTGLDCAFVFAVLLAIFASLHGLAARFAWFERFGLQQAEEQRRVALAPSVAAALITCFMMGCLRPAQLQPLTLPTLH